MARHAMSSMDAAWLHMDGPAHPAVVNGLVLTAKPLDAEALGYVLRNRLLHFDRFRQRVVEPALGLGLPQWWYSMWLPILSLAIALRALGRFNRLRRAGEQP